MKTCLTNLTFIDKFIIIVIVFVSIIFIIGYLKEKNKSNITSPVEDNKIDPIMNDNYNIITEIKHLDSIKNEKIDEIKNLDNDSTIKLFYKLIGK